ncbi:unnamed protein product [Linum tenue]|uniref:Amine oxidase domain-containing protein n=1 Tax=Linum tenue TaxID=586396 RepID=A0AAV0QLH1_9ROSI|nr:unnamed protein product [Linum tenue]CAI0549612.1 unnamed protein product [Linum tenue]
MLRNMHLSAAMKLLLSLLVLLLAVSSATVAAPPPSSVIVIGAGLSGIAAAKTLHDAGIKDIVILEATPKIGGRLSKVAFAGQTMEVGACWYFGGGPQHNPLVDIANSLKLNTYPTNFGNLSSNTYKQQGGLYPKAEVDAALGAGAARAQFCTNLSTTLNSNPRSDQDVSVMGAYLLYKHVPATPLEMVVDYFNNDYIDAQAPQLTSVKHKYPRHELVDHGVNFNYVKDPRGFESMAYHIADQFLKKGDPRLKLNKVVREISYSKKGVTVKTEDGSVFQAKFAILSASLGVLQSNLISFKPEFPMWKRVAISDFSMATYTKIFIKFPHKFWPTGPGTEVFFYAHQHHGYYPIWKHLENEYPGSNILFVTVTGDESIRIEKQSDEATKAEAMEVLKKMFGNNIPNPDAILVPRWWTNRFFKGSYVNWPPRYSHEQFQHLQAPVGPVYFTGEHTSEKYMGFATGAYFSGIESANDVIKCLNRKICRAH